MQTYGDEIKTGKTVKRTILMLLLAAMSTGAMAEWVQVGGNDTTTTYADPSTIRKNGNIAKMWHMYDLRVPQMKSFGKFRSTKRLEESDCEGARSRILKVVFYSGQMGNGGVVISRDSSGGSLGDWEHVTPETLGETLWKTACGKMAEWVELSQSDTAVFYADPTTIRKNGNVVSMWTLTDYKTPQFGSSKDPHLSTLHQLDFDCIQETRRLRSITVYSGAMGAGAVLDTFTRQDDWRAVVHGTSGKTDWKFACGKK